MASPKWHTLATGIEVLIYIALGLPVFYLLDPVNAMAIIFFSIGFDADHISGIRISFKKGFRIELLEKDNHLNFMHTVAAIVVITLFFIGIWILSSSFLSFVPLVLYYIHILIDSGNKSNRISNRSPLPVLIHNIFPNLLTYTYGKKKN